MKKNFFKLSILLLSLFLVTVSSSFADGQVDINTANIKELSVLKGVSKVRAAAIVKYREENGPYQSIEDLKKVKGIAEKTIEKNRSQITLGSLSSEKPKQMGDFTQ